MTRILLLLVFVLQPATALVPERLAPGVISTSAIETDGTFLPDGQTLFFSRRAGQWGEEMQYSAIFVSRMTPKGWGSPVIADFSGEWSDDDVFAAPDGRAVVFVSQRPTPDGADHDRDIWMTAATGDGWGEATHLPAPVSSPALDIGPSIAANGTLYFASDRPGGHGSGDLYRARLVDGGYPEVENLGPVVNGPSGEWNVLVAPDESFLIFESSGREGGLGPGGDLYLSYRTEGRGERRSISMRSPRRAAT